MGWRERGRPAETGRWGWSGYKIARYGFFRDIRTTQEIRNWDRELGRMSRSPSQIPDCYEELIRTVQRSWKEHRKTQWKHRRAA
jgi:hypothetical protein